MKKYKVIALNVSGLGNVVHYLNEEVTEDQFTPGHADKLVQQGFLQVQEEPKEEEEELKQVQEEPKEEPQRFKKRK